MVVADEVILVTATSAAVEATTANFFDGRRDGCQIHQHSLPLKSSRNSRRPECTLSKFALYADFITPMANYCADSTSASSSTRSSAGTDSTATKLTVASDHLRSTSSAVSGN
ncbi:hypothetical protein GN244_ATG13753 [Phytophthora infestans]|uniref:Uncharacterized protein n=1 Tax=Phytophthora infestans TaxID=4787 RepID=A0A833SWL1_PHYIN|nr:hypothetical protein GN244_ATG13753 [Phytophthora infestans]